MCYFQICLDLSDRCNNVNGMKTWADYLFSCLDGSPEEISFVAIDEEVKTRMKYNGFGKFILEEDIRSYEPGEFSRATITRLDSLSLAKLSWQVIFRYG